MAMRINAILLLAGCFAIGGRAREQELSFLRAISSTNSLETAAAVTTDATGVYVAGMSAPAHYYESYTDAFVRKFDPAGSLLWERTFGGPVSLRSVVAADGAVYVAGSTAWNLAAQVYYVLPGQIGAGFADAFVRRYDPDGKEVWTRQFGSDAADMVTGLAVDSTGVYVVGNFGAFVGSRERSLRKFDLNGNELWTQKLTVGYAVAVGGAAVYVAGVDPSSAVGGTWSSISRYDREGSLVWTQPVEFQASVFSVAADGSGVYISGGSLDSSDSFVRKYDISGNVLWTRHIPTQSGMSLSLDKDALYVGGTVVHALPGQCAAGADDAFVRAYGFDGTELWTRQFGSYYRDSANVIATTTGNVYVAGTQDTGDLYPQVQRTYLAKLSRASDAPSSAPRIRAECVLNAANFLGGAVAPGEIVTVLGSGLGPLTPVDGGINPEGRLPNLLADARVLFNGVAAPLLTVSDTLIRTIVPVAMADQTMVEVQVEYKGLRSPGVSFPVLPSRPGVFTQNGSGIGPSAALNQDGTVNSPSNPAARGSILSLYATGLGITDPPLTDGQLVTGPSPTIKGPVSVVFTNDGYIDDGMWANVVYAGAVTGMVSGLVQINVQVPDYPWSTPGAWAPQVFREEPWANKITSENLGVVNLQ